MLGKEAGSYVRANASYKPAVREQLYWLVGPWWMEGMRWEERGWKNMGRSDEMPREKRKLKVAV